MHTFCFFLQIGSNKFFRLLMLLCFWLLQTSSFFLHIFKIQFTEKRIQIGGKQPSSLFLASISLLLSEQVPFAEKDLAL